MSASYDIKYVPSIKNDKMWFDLGKTFNTIKDKCTHSQSITSRSYGTSHKMNSSIWNINLDGIASILDDMVCGSYPPYVYSINSNDLEVSLTRVFYDFPQPDIIRTNEGAYRQGRYKKAYLKDDKYFIEEFIAHLRIFLKDIININVIKNHKKINTLNQKLSKVEKSLDRFEELFREAEVIEN